MIVKQLKPKRKREENNIMKTYQKPLLTVETLVSENAIAFDISIGDDNIYDDDATNEIFD